MKSIYFLLTLTGLIVGSLSSAFAGNRICGTQLVCRGHYPYRSCNHVYSCGYDACSPEVRESNLAVVEQVLSELAKDPGFVQAEAFLARVKSVEALPDPAQKVEAYLKTLAIDPQSNEEFVGFVFGREIPRAQILALEKNVGLTTAQAELVADRLKVALRGVRLK